MPVAAAGEAARISAVLIYRAEIRRENRPKLPRMERVLSGRASLFCARVVLMSSVTTDLWGQDIALDDSGQARVAANGELLLTDGVETGVQDIRLRLFTRLGNLFYDREFGSLIHDWILEDSTAGNRAAFESEIVMRVEEDPRVVVGSVRCTVTAWDARSITALASWRFLDEDTPLNLVLQVNKLTMELVIEDADPRTDSFTPCFPDD